MTLYEILSLLFGLLCAVAAVQQFNVNIRRAVLITEPNANIPLKHSLLNRFMFIWITIIGTLLILLIAISITVISVVRALPQSWTESTYIGRLQDATITGVSNLVAPQKAALPTPVVPSAGNIKPAQTSSFKLSVSPIGRSANEIKVKSTIENITPEPIFLALDNSRGSTLIDNTSNTTSNISHHEGISGVYANAMDPMSYTKIEPGQKLEAVIYFQPFPPHIGQTNSQGSLTINIFTLHKGAVTRDTLSLLAPIVFGLGIQ